MSRGKARHLKKQKHRNRKITKTHPNNHQEENRSGIKAKASKSDFLNHVKRKSSGGSLIEEETVKNGVMVTPDFSVKKISNSPESLKNKNQKKIVNLKPSSSSCPSEKCFYGFFSGIKNQILMLKRKFL